MPIECTQIRNAVTAFNNNTRYVNDEKTLKRALASTQRPETDLACWLANTFLVAEWGSLGWVSFVDRVLIAEEIYRAWPQILNHRQLTLDAWLNNQQIMDDAINDLATTQLLKPPGTENTQLSFMSKMLHWCVNPIFPIWDGNARTAMTKNKETPNDERSWNSYKDWTRLISKQLREHRVNCLQELATDGECVVRTLDKALYIIGG